MKPMFFILCTISIINYIETSDPCKNYTEIDDWKRSVANDDSSSLLCDSFLKDGWYRSVSLAGNDMPTQCPEGGFRCGTGSPIWINGTHPAPGQTLNVTACASDYEECCKKSYEIQVKNCNGFYVYYLRKVHGCAQAYCFGKELPCPKGYSSKNGFTPGCKFDPCLPVNYQELNQWERSVKNNFSENLLCDSFLKAGWYKPISKAGNLMPTTCQPYLESCGTTKPIWMKGQYPRIGEIANVTSCVSDLRNCCSHSYDIQVKNCSTFNVYNLLPTQGCAQAYCFGSEVPCATGYSSATGFTPGCEFDPCLEVNYKLLKGEVKRSSNYTLQPDDKPIDDLKLDTGWYRVDSASGNDIVNISQPLDRCGTKFPIWMKGNIPKKSEKTVQRSVCMTGLNNDCESTFFVKMRNCGSFRTYFLKKANLMNSAYCFGTLPVVVVKAYDKDSDSDKNLKIKILIPVVAVVAVVSGIILGYLLRMKVLSKAAVSCVDKPPSPPTPYYHPTTDQISDIQRFITE